MPIDWNALPAKPRVHGENTAPTHFGDLDAELSAAGNSNSSVVAVTDLAWIRCSGEDAQPFLHNQLTSDIVHLKPGRWQHSAWCSAKGRMLANFMVARPSAEPSFDLCMPAELVPAILKRLRMYVLRSKVILEDLSASCHALGLKGKDVGSTLAATGLPLPDTIGEVQSFEGGWVTRTADDCCIVTLEDATATARLSVMSEHVRLVGLAAWHWLEVQSGIPTIRKSTQEEFVPQMVNFDKIGGVSFHKGCYPGQEIVARTQYLGKVKRHLYRIHSTQPISPGQNLYQASQELDPSGACGIVANAAQSPRGGWDGLAVILENAIGAQIHADAPNGPNISNIDLVAA